jgi:DNA polymerase III epsilon subunit-like protein
MRELVFLDTECTGLDHEADIWEFAAVRRHTDGTESRLHIFIEHDDAKAAQLPKSFRADYLERCPDPDKLVPQRKAAMMIAEFIDYDAVVVGAVAAFDSQRLATLFARHRMGTPAWLYTVVDVCALAAGYLRALGESVEFPAHVESVGRRLGIEAEDYPRHTALGDVEFVQAIFDRCNQPARPLRVASPQADRLVPALRNAS